MAPTTTGRISNWMPSPSLFLHHRAASTASTAEKQQNNSTTINNSCDTPITIFPPRSYSKDLAKLYHKLISSNITVSIHTLILISQ